MGDGVIGGRGRPRPVDVDVAPAAPAGDQSLYPIGAQNAGPGRGAAVVV